MMIFDLLNAKKKELKFLGKTNENIDLIARSITEFKKHGIKIEEIEKEIKTVKDPALKMKLEDMLCLYQGFQKKIQDNYIDENDVLTILAQNIEESKEFQDSIIYIDEFAGFTKQEYDIIQKLLKQAKEVTITVNTDSLEESVIPDTDLFYPNKVTVGRLREMLIKNGVKENKPIYLGKAYRYHSKELEHLEKNLYQNKIEKYPNEVEDIHLFLANNPYTEVEKIAEEIIFLVKEKKYRYRDISIITKQLEQYASLIKGIFEKYHIPVFIDEKKELNQNIIVKYILSILEIFSKNWSYESVFQYLKSGFSNLEEEDIYRLENYCIRWGIKGNKCYKQDWNYGIITEDDKKQVEWLNELRRNITYPLLKFYQSVQEQKNVKQITKILYEFLKEEGIEQKVKNKVENLQQGGLLELANEYEASFEIIISVLDEMVLVFGEEQITFEKYMEYLKIGLKNSGLGKIPAMQDSVTVGDAERSRSHKVKAIFIIGLNDGVFPSNKQEEGFFNDQDREILKQDGVELAKGSLEQLYDDQFNIYKAFSTAEEKLYLSYPSSDQEGKSLRISMMISKVKKMFPKIKEESDMISDSNEILVKETAFEKLIQKLREKKEGKEIEPIWYEIYQYYSKKEGWKEKLETSIQGLEYTNKPQTIEKELITKLYGNTLHTTISRLEQYRSCAFSFYLKYGLKISEKKTFKIQSLDTGSFMHEVIDTFFTQLREENKKITDLTEESLKDMVSKIVEEKLGLSKNDIFNSTPKFKVLTNRLKRVIMQAMKYIIESLKDTDFYVIENEVEFKKGSSYPPIQLELENGKKVEITGKIDRIDLGKNAEGNYIRIIDYKSAVKNIDLNEVMTGLQIQLLTYLDAACKEDEIPAGVLYFQLIDPIIKANKSMTEEEIKAEIQKRFKMNGLILADVNVVKMMDKTLESGASKKIPAYIDKEGNLSKSKSSAVTKEQFYLLQKYIKKTMKEISLEIMSGKIDLNPYYNPKNKRVPCEYCEYRSVCQFKRGFCENDYHYLTNFSQSEVLEKIKNCIENS